MASLLANEFRHTFLTAKRNQYPSCVTSVGYTICNEPNYHYPVVAFNLIYCHETESTYSRIRLRVSRCCI